MKIYKIYRYNLFGYAIINIIFLMGSLYLIYLFIPFLSKFDFDFKAFIATVIVFSLCAFLGLYQLFLFIICYKYDKTTIIKYDKISNEVEYDNRYNGRIKFNINDIIQYTSYRLPRSLFSYLAIELNDGREIYITYLISYDICEKNKNLKHEVKEIFFPKIIFKKIIG